MDDDVAAVAFAEENILVQLVNRRCRSRRFRAGPNAHIVHPVTIQIITSRTGEIKSRKGLFETLALLPAHDVPIAEVLHQQFDGTFTAYFENHTLVVARHVGVARLRRSQVGIRMGVGLREREIRNIGPLAQRVDRQFNVVLGQRPQLGFRFGIIEKYLGGAKQR